MIESPYSNRRRGLPSPGSGSGGGPASRILPGPAYNPQPGDIDPSSGLPYNMPKQKYGMDYTGKFRTGPANFRPGRNLPVTQILSQREGNVAARYGDGRAVPAGMRINVPGFNTSGVGPGTRGYSGSFQNGAYNYGQGTGRPLARTSDDYYTDRGSPLDRFNNNARTRRGSDWLGVDGFRQYGGPVRRGGRYVVGESGPEVVVMPQDGYVVPNPRSRRAPSFRNSDEYYAFRDQTVGNPLDRGVRRYGAPTVSQYPMQPMRDVTPMGSDWAADLSPEGQWYSDDLFSSSALDEIEGRSSPYDGEIREGRDGRMWRYDANLGRGVPVNVYDEPGNLYAPSPAVELMDPQERYRDLQMRLDAIRNEADRSFQDRRQFEEAQFVQPKVQGLTELPDSGGRRIGGRYGTGRLNSTPVAKSFTVDTEDGDQVRFNNLPDAARESAAASASRRIRSRRY